jgi:outer membrane protein assembly factor BamB
VSFCERCEAYLEPDAAICPKCGAPRTRESEAETIWFPELGETPTGSLLATDELLIVPSQGEGLTAQHTTVRAFGLRDRALRWQQQLEHASVSGMACAGDLILVATYSTDLLRGQGVLMALDTTGVARWSWTPDAQRISAPAVGGNVVCVTIDTKTLFVLDAATGTERARAHLEASASPAAPAVIGDVAYVPCRGPHLLAVGVDGRLHWPFTDQDDPDAWLDKTPVLAGGNLCAVSTTGTVLALSTETGELAWRTSVGPPGKPLSPPATDGDSLYVGARDGLHALGGDVVWHVSTERRITAAPVVADGVVYAAGHDHNLYALDAATGLELWHVELTRRIEVAPAIGGDLVLVADRDGHVVAVKRTVSATVRASAHAATGEFRRAAVLLEEQKEPFKAAEMYKEAGDLTRASGLYERAGALQQAADMLKAAGEREQAAVLYEQAGAWMQAIELWAALGRPLKQAEAMVKYAESLDEQSHRPEELATLWEQAARCFAAEGDTEQAAACRRHVARYHQWPILNLDVHSEGLVVNAWSRIQLFVHNEGYGSARNLVVRAEGSQFEGQVMATQRIATLHAGRTREEWLDVRPLEYGDSVPLRVSVEYADRDGQSQVYQETLYMPVARTGDARQEGQVYNINVSGPVTVGGGEAVDMRGAQGAVYKPGGPVEQHFGDVVHQADAGRPQEGREARVPSAAPARYRDLDLLIDGSQQNGYRVRIIHSPAGEASGKLALPFTLEELDDTWQQLEMGTSGEGFLRDVGSRLFDALFDGAVGDRFHNSQGMLTEDQGLRLRLRVEAGELLSVPWELLHDPGRRDFLCLTRDVPIVRHLPVPHPAAIPALEPPLHMLVVPASPEDMPPLAVENEVALLRQAVQPLVDENLLAIEVLSPPTVRALRTFLVDRPCHILHFIGHGGLNQGGGYIAFENAERKPRYLYASELKVLFSDTSLRLVVLAACLSARDVSAEGAPGRAYLGVAPAIVDAGVPAVVAMQFSLPDLGGRVFAHDFYKMLARHEPVEEAVDQARVAVVLELGLSCRDWAAPVLFLRGDSGELFPG